MIKPVNPKENPFWTFIGRTDAEDEAPILWPSDVKNWLHGKDLNARKDWRQEEKGMTEDEMVGWHHWLNGHEVEQAPGLGDGQGSLVPCSPWGHKDSGIQFSLSVGSDSLKPHEPQHARPPCPSPTPRVHPNPCPLSWWCHPTILSSVVPFSPCPQSLLESGSFPMSQLFAWGSQSTGVSALASVLPVNTQDWSPLGWTGWISLQSKGLSGVFSNTTVQKHQFFDPQLSL